MQAFILQTRHRSGIRKKNHCTRMACPLARFKPDVWDIMVRTLYVNGKKYDTVAQLKSSILEVWKPIENEIRHTLINSMPNRIFKWKQILSYPK